MNKKQDTWDYINVHLINATNKLTYAEINAGINGRAFN